MSFDALPKTDGLTKWTPTFHCMLSQSGLGKVTLAYCILAAHARKQTPGALGHADAHRKHAHAHHPNTNKAKNVKNELKGATIARLRQAG